MSQESGAQQKQPGETHLKVHGCWGWSVLAQHSCTIYTQWVLCNLMPLPELPYGCQGSDLVRIFLSQGTSRHPDEEIQLRELFQTEIFPNTPRAPLGLCVGGVAVPGSSDLLLGIRLFGKDSHATH